MVCAKPLRSATLLAVFLSCGCSAPVDIGAASGAGKRFHEEFNQQNYDKIYQEADPKFRAAVEPEAWSKLMTRLHDKLGNVTDMTRTGFNVNYNVGGSTVTMSYSTKFQLGTGQEEFVWLKSNHELRLLRYNVRSSALDESNVQ